MQTAIRARRRSGTGTRLGALALGVLSTVLALFFMLPFIWALLSGLKNVHEVMLYPPRLFPRIPQWVNFRTIWVNPQGRFDLFMANTALVALLGVLGTVLSSLIVAYGFARFRFRGRALLFTLVLSGLMMPTYITIITQFDIFRRIGWVNSFKPLVVPLFFGQPFAIFLFRQFMLSIPYDFDESAIIDGASRLRILVSIIIPNCTAVIAAVSLFSFRHLWNQFLAPLIFLDRTEKFTLTLGLYMYKSSPDLYDLPSQDHLLMAAAVLTTLPVLLVFGMAQSFFVKGVMMSGLKG